MNLGGDQREASERWASSSSAFELGNDRNACDVQSGAVIGTLPNVFAHNWLQKRKVEYRHLVNSDSQNVTECFPQFQRSHYLPSF